MPWRQVGRSGSFLTQLRTPLLDEIVEVLRTHSLVRMREPVQRAFLVGSFAGGKPHSESDVDILLEVPPRDGYSSAELEEHYRAALRQYFVTNNIRGKADGVHPQWEGRRVDLYFTYDADQELRPKIELDRAPPCAVLRPEELVRGCDGLLLGPNGGPAVFYHGGKSFEAPNPFTFFSLDRDLSILYVHEKEIVDGCLTAVNLTLPRLASDDDVADAAKAVGAPQEDSPYMYVSDIHVGSNMFLRVRYELMKRGYDGALLEDGDFGRGSSWSFLVFDPDSVRIRWREEVLPRARQASIVRP